MVRGTFIKRMVRELKSAKELQDLVQNKLTKELLVGWIAGPFVHWSLNNLITSPLGVVLFPKKQQESID